MKVSIVLLIFILLVSIGHFLFDFGLLGTPAYEYKALAAAQMDEIGFKKLAEENGIKVEEDGKIKFPNEMRSKLVKFNMLPYTIAEIEKEGWILVTVTSDDHYLFRKRK